jgi:16S rRNA pseudouridine516 synthase
VHQNHDKSIVIITFEFTSGVTLFHSQYVHHDFHNYQRFNLPGMSKIPLDRILQSQGFGTRKWCRELIENGDVSISGEQVFDSSKSFDTDTLEFTVFDESYLFHKQLYIALNKPANYECSRKPSHHPGVFSLLPEQFSRRDIQPVGRLDHDTTGLLLLSDDGAFIHAQSSPKRHVPKIYVATTYELITPQLVEKLLGGVKLKDEIGTLAAVSCKMIDSNQLELEVEQGKYHQVKRMLVAAGNHCTALRRSQIGNLTLESLALKEGEWCYLNEAQLLQLASQSTH